MWHLVVIRGCKIDLFLFLYREWEDYSPHFWSPPLTSFLLHLLPVSVLPFWTTKDTRFSSTSRFILIQRPFLSIRKLNLLTGLLCVTRGSELTLDLRNRNSNSNSPPWKYVTIPGASLLFSTPVKTEVRPLVTLLRLVNVDGASIGTIISPDSCSINH